MGLEKRLERLEQAAGVGGACALCGVHDGAPLPFPVSIEPGSAAEGRSCAACGRAVEVEIGDAGDGYVVTVPKAALPDVVKIYGEGGA